MLPAHDDRLTATLLGTALGDALGLAAEGMSARAIARRFGRVDRYHLLGSLGFVSDDTEQSALVAQSLRVSPGDPAGCVRAFRWSLLGWFLRLPWGIGLATLRACVKIALGLRRTGVRSAGNGAAMRAAIVGSFLREDAAARRAMSDALAEVTHTDPRGVQGARYVAELAGLCAACDDPMGDRKTLCTQAISCVEEPSLKAAIESALTLAAGDAPTATLAERIGTTGFVMHTVPFAAAMFVRHGASVLGALSETVAAGGDTDSIAAIVGAWLGALHGTHALPQHLLTALHDGPFGPTHLQALARDLAASPSPTRRARYAWPVAMLRNLALYPVVLAHGFRRLVPF